MRIVGTVRGGSYTWPALVVVTLILYYNVRAIMIVEAAFWKLLGSLVRDHFPQNHVEDTLRSNLIQGLHQELTALGVGAPSDCTKPEYKYSGLSREQPNWRADIYAKFELGLDGRCERYGFKPENWIETKFFTGIIRGQHNQATTTNAAEIARDLVRLCLLVEEYPGRIRDKARYLLVVFNESPKKYIAFTRRNGSERERKWLRSILQPGYCRVLFNLKNEPISFRTQLGNGFKEDDHGLALELVVTVQAWEPVAPSSCNTIPVFWGYLVRIDNFTVCLDDYRLTYFDEGREKPDYWSAHDLSVHRNLVACFCKYGTRGQTR